MERIATLFCHVPEGLSEAEMRQGLQRQHDVLAQHAARAGRVIEHCFFHVGEFDLENPDPVLLRFLQRAQAEDLGLVFIESRELFPIAQQGLLPKLKVFFVQENRQEIIGSEDAQVEAEDAHPRNMYMYWGF